MRPAIELDLSLVEAAHLTDLIDQFLDVLTVEVGTAATADPAIARLVPDAYPDDADAAGEFRRLTQADLLDRRRSDARAVAATLFLDGEPVTPASLDPARRDERLRVPLDSAASQAWLRTLSALRLVLATRLGIETEDDHADDDPRFGVYDWLGYRLDGLVRALSD